MTTGDMLLQAILDEPDADDLRLIYADWLEDHGEEERAEFIRASVSCPDAHLATNLGWLQEKKLSVLMDKWRLLQQLKALPRAEIFGLPPGFGVWLGGEGLGAIIREEGLGAIIRRGFAHTVYCPTAVWLQRRVELVRQHPIQRVKLMDKEAVLCTEQDGLDIADKYRWSRFVGGEEGETNHYIGGGLIPGPADMNLGVWSIHDTREEADAWLSERLIARAKELAAQQAAEETKREE